MEFFQDGVIVSEIKLAVFFPKEKGTPVERQRTTHALVLNVDCRSVYRFDTGQVLNCQPGDCIFLPEGSRYTAARYKETDSEKRGVYVITFSTLPGEGIPEPFTLHLRGRDEMISLFSKAASAWRKKETGFYEECCGYLYHILYALKKELSYYAPQSATLAVIAPALRYIDQYYTEEAISVSHLAQLCHVSEPYLRRLFQRVFFVSPAVYIRNLRIRYAKELLATGEYTVTDAATQAGFNDVAYFSREFKKATGASPKNYK